MPIKVSNLIEQLDLPLMRAPRRNSGKHRKQKWKFPPTAPYFKLTIFQAAVGNLLQQHVKPSGKASALLKSKLSGHRGMRQLMGHVPWITGFVAFINSSFQAVQSTTPCNHTVTSNQHNGFLSRLETDAANGWCESVNQSAQYEDKFWAASQSLYAKVRVQLHYISLPSEKKDTIET